MSCCACWQAARFTLHRKMRRIWLRKQPMHKARTEDGNMKKDQTMRGLGRAAASALLLVLLAACSVEPTYKRPDAPTPAAFKEAPAGDAKDMGTWKTAEPADAAHRGEWWAIFGDPVLNDLEQQAAAANQDLKAAAARV